MWSFTTLCSLPGGALGSRATANDACREKPSEAVLAEMEATADRLGEEEIQRLLDAQVAELCPGLKLTPGAAVTAAGHAGAEKVEGVAAALHSFCARANAAGFPGAMTAISFSALQAKLDGSMPSAAPAPAECADGGSSVPPAASVPTVCADDGSEGMPLEPPVGTLNI